VTGATGLIGGALTRLLRSEGITVLTVGRGADSDVRWSPDRDELDPKGLEGLDAIVHLAGAPIDVRWTQRRRHEIRNSRVLSTQLLSRTLAGCRASRACSCADPP
jgi:NAD dependent epimerase/dehydratase family enzyme